MQKNSRFNSGSSNQTTVYMDWNDLQHLFALAKRNTLPEAAEALRVNRTTIARRIARLEETLGAKLVERIGRDLVLTDAGREAAASAEIIDGEFQNLQRRLFGRDQQLAGAIRLVAEASRTHARADSRR